MMRNSLFLSLLFPLSLGMAAVESSNVANEKGLSVDKMTTFLFKGSEGVVFANGQETPRGDGSSHPPAAQEGKTLTFPTLGNISPAQGTLELRFRPRFQRNGKDAIDIYRFFASRDEVSKLGAFIGVNHYPGKGVYQLWFHITQAGGAVRGLDQAVEIKPGVEHHLAACWDARSISLHLDGKYLGSLHKEGVLPLGDRFHIGGDPALTDAYCGRGYRRDPHLGHRSASSPTVR